MRATALTLTVLAVLALVFFGLVILPPGWIPRGGGDLVSLHWFTYRYAAQSLQAGRIPLWKPTLYSGAPFVADNQSVGLSLTTLTRFGCPALGLWSARRSWARR